MSEELIPLSEIAAFDDKLRSRLKDYWIVTAQDFVGTLRSGVAAHGGGSGALAVALEVEPERIKALYAAVMDEFDARGIQTSFGDTFGPIDEGAGLIMDDLEDLEEDGSFDTEALAQIKPEVIPDVALPPVIDQGSRNTCVACSIATIYQYLRAKAEGKAQADVDLSEQFIYWLAKENDGLKGRGDVGTKPDVALRLVQNFGACTEAAWAYDATRRDDNPGHGPPPPGAEAEAANHRISGFRQIGAKDIRGIQAALSQGWAVLIGLPIYEHWGSASPARKLGKLRKPLPGERKGVGHAMAILGYRPDPQAPGGGYFIIRNSWGPSWAAENPDGPGFAHVPYRFVADEGIIAFAVEGVLL